MAALDLKWLYVNQGRFELAHRQSKWRIQNVIALSFSF